MMKGIREIPRAFRRQIIVRLIGSILFIFLFVLMWGTINDWKIFVSGMTCCVVMVGSTWDVLARAYAGEYVRIEGECLQIEGNGFLHKDKSIDLILEQGIVKILVHERLRQLQVGDIVTAYVPEKASVYESGGIYVISDYYVMDVRKRDIEHRVSQNK